MVTALHAGGRKVPLCRFVLVSLTQDKVHKFILLGSPFIVKNS